MLPRARSLLRNLKRCTLGHLTLTCLRFCLLRYCRPMKICILQFNLKEPRTHVPWRMPALGVRSREIQLSAKIRKKLAKILFHQKTHGARRRIGGEARGLHTHRGRSPALAAPTCCEGGSAISSTPPSAYIYPLTLKYLGYGVFPRKTSAAPPPLETVIQNQKLYSGTLPGQGFGGDLHHHHHRCPSIDHP
jgi:hypothetical protein